MSPPPPVAPLLVGLEVGRGGSSCRLDDTRGGVASASETSGSSGYEGQGVRCSLHTLPPVPAAVSLDRMHGLSEPFAAFSHATPRWPSLSASRGGTHQRQLSRRARRCWTAAAWRGTCTPSFSPHGVRLRRVGLRASRPPCSLVVTEIANVSPVSDKSDHDTGLEQTHDITRGARSALRLSSACPSLREKRTCSAAGSSGWGERARCKGLALSHRSVVVAPVRLPHPVERGVVTGQGALTCLTTTTDLLHLRP